jgi:iron complex transport system substrate-binding protein
MAPRSGFMPMRAPSSPGQKRRRNRRNPFAVFPPRRIVCLTEETVETLYLLGEQERIVGISGYTVRPPQARREKPRVSAFISADIGKIEALEPDLVLAFSDLQAEIVAELARRGIAVHLFNQRDIAGILDMVRMLGALVESHAKAEELVSRLEAGMAAVRRRANARPTRPRVFFEEWDEPSISAIRWVSELIEIAGGMDVFAARSHARSAKDRIVSGAETIAAAPDLIIGSWCGKKFRPERVAARPGFAAIPAVRSGAVFEIKSSIILQPGPAALTDGLAALETLIHDRANVGAVPMPETAI